MATKTKRPDCTFTVTVCPVQQVIGCDAKRDQESRGLIGFHNFDTCPNCQKVDKGYEFWGENGHKQAAVSDRAGLVHWIKVNARKQWVMQSGQIMGYRFRKGSTMHYRG